MARGEQFNRSLGDEEPRGRWLTRAAFVIGVGVVVARVTMLETVRDPFAVPLGGQAIPKGAGAASGVVLDALAWVPLMLILVRRVVDSEYRVRPARSQLCAAGLAAWALVSVTWASDKFVAAVGAFHFASAVVLFVAMAQLVRSWARLRLVAAVAFGLLLVFGAQGVYYRFVELPDLQRSFEQNKESILRERGWEPGSFQAEQFSRKITNSEMIGFNASPNTFAAMIVLVSVITMGVMVQRVADRDGPGWVAVYLVGLGLGAWVIWCTHGKGAMAALALGAGAIGVMWVVPAVRRWLGTHAKLGYCVGVGAVMLGIVAVVGHGLYHGGLPSDSLNFRWRYWVGTMRLFKQHPLVGVGWNNFGPHYLGTRLVAAAEEIKDPHNVLLKFLVELGAAGGVLAVAWLLWMWRDLTRPVLPAADDSPLRIGVERGGSSPIGRVAMIAGAGMLFNVLASVDLDEQIAFVVVELFKRGLFFCVLVIGGAMVALRQVEQREPDDRFAGWIVHGTLIGLGLFLVQSLIDVAFFEVGAMYLFFMLAGSAMGMRGAEKGRERKVGAVAALAGISVAWVAGLAIIVAPVVRGEIVAGMGDDDMRARRPDRAAARYGEAWDAVPWDAEYAYRAGRAAIAAGDATAAQRWLDRALAGDPVAVEYRLTRSQLEAERPGGDRERAAKDYADAVRLNPNDVGMRVGYAEFLSKLGRTADARQEYRIALEKNEGYDATEPKRLSAAEVARIRQATGE